MRDAIRMIAVAALLASFGMTAEAGTEPQIITRDKVITPSQPEAVKTIHTPGTRANSQVIVHPVVDPTVTVDKALAEQPVHPHKIKVVIRGGVTIYLDPDKDYVHQGPNPIGANTLIPRAQMLHRHLTASPRIITGKAYKQTTEADDAEAAQPKVKGVIIIKHPDAKSIIKNTDDEPSESSDKKLKKYPVIRPHNPSKNLA